MADDFDDDHDLREADALLRKADALLSRGRVASEVAAPAVGLSFEDDDLPLVTEIIAETALPPRSAAAEAPAAAAPSSAPQQPHGEVQLAEQLIDLDTMLQREIETWLGRELPEIVGRELDALRSRIRAEVLGQLRATLLPKLSEEIAQRLTRKTQITRPGP